jgi:folate-binding protein YgfZ
VPKNPGPMAELHRQAGVALNPMGAPLKYGPVAAAYRAAHDSAIIVDQGRIGVVDLVGKDVRRWSNGMFTQNFRDAKVGSSLHSGWCDDRGRLQGLFQAALLADDHIRIVLGDTSADAFVEHFDRYVLVDDVEFYQPEMAVFSAMGPRAVHGLGAVGLHPKTGELINHANDITLLPSVRALVSCTDVVVPLDRATDLWKSLVAAGMFAAAMAVGEVLRVESGTIRFGVDSAAKALPHELALRDHILSFEKGCYVGQETINRLDVMGKARKGLAGVISDAPMTTGDSVFVGDKAVGTVTSPVLSPRFGHIALSVVRKPYDQGETVRIGETGQGRTCPVPFPVAETPFPAF